MTTSSLPPISELLSGFAFNTSPPGTPLELTYSFETSVPTSGSWAFDPTWTPFSSAEQAYVQQALANVSAFANVTFTEVTGTAEINYGNSTSSDQELMGTSFGKTELPTPENPVAYTAFNGAYFTPTPYYPLADNEYLATHELGNALGLLDLYGPQTPLGPTTWTIPAQYTNSDYTTMAGVTFNESHNSPPNFENPVGFQLLDILALQYLYGVNENGYTPSYQDTAATITSTSLTYSITDDSAPETIWVGSNVASVKCFDFSECTSSVAINLNAGTFSSNYVGPAIYSGFAAGANDAIAIALKTVINVGIGDNQADTLIADSTPGHNDVLIGGTGGDSFTAGAGKDIFVGGGGIDTAIFHDPEADYSITNLGSGVVVVTDNASSPTDGTVVLDGSFTSLQFADQTVTEAANVRPSGLTAVVSAPAAIIEANQDAINYLVNKGAVSSVVDTDTGTGANSVANDFQTILQRAPTQTELNHYLAVEENGSLSPAGLIETLIATPEAQTDVFPVVALYQAVYGRVPDATGLQYWTGVYESLLSSVPETTGSTVNQAMVDLATPFVNPAITPEFVARYGANPDASTYVTELYGNVLDRQPDVTGQTYWTGVLSNLLQIDTPLNARALLLEQFVDSSEYRANSQPYIHGFLAASAKGTESYQGSLFQQTPDTALPPASTPTPLVGLSMSTASHVHA